MPVESALVALIPEAERVVGGFRARFDPSAAAGVPPHITIIYPFKLPWELSMSDIQKLSELFAGTPSFRVRFTRTGTFPAVLYLAPEPAGPFLQLTAGVSRLFPETPPYCGKFADIVPHLTVAHSGDAQELERIAGDFRRQTASCLSIDADVNEVVLMANESGRWQVRYRFPLEA